MARKPRTSQAVVVLTPLMTPSVESMVLQAMRVGAPAKHAAMAAGIRDGTFRSWISRGRDELSRRDNGLEANGTYDRHVTLVEKVDQAEAEASVANVISIQRAATQLGKWQAAAWMLSRRFPNEWGPPEQRINVHMEDVNAESPRDDMLARLNEIGQRLEVGIGNDTDI